MNGPEGLPALASDRCLVMGVLNVTPDSFSDGGRWLDPGAALEHGLALLSEGADLIDVGGESTRPGAEHVPEAEELRRVVPVIRELARAGAVVSIDTMRARVAAEALDAGAVLVNDVTGGRGDPQLPALLARTGAPFVAMHWRAHRRPGQAGAEHGRSDEAWVGRPVHDDDPRYLDVVSEVTRELARRLEALTEAGVDPRRVVLDPGLGFSKNAGHNWGLLAGLDALVALGLPVLIGASRKRFLGSLLAGRDAGPVPVEQRDAATAAISMLAAMAGVWCVRVHDVGPSADAVRVAAAVRRARATAGDRGDCGTDGEGDGAGPGVGSARMLP